MKAIMYVCILVFFASCSEAIEQPSKLLRVAYKVGVFPAQNICSCEACECGFTVPYDHSAYQDTLALFNEAPFKPLPDDEDAIQVVLQFNYLDTTWILSSTGHLLKKTIEPEKSFSFIDFINTQFIGQKDMIRLANIIEPLLVDIPPALCRKGQIIYPHIGAVLID